MPLETFSADESSPLREQFEEYPFLANEEIRQVQVRKKKKPTLTKKVDLKEFFVDNELREMAGLQKLKSKPATPLSENIHGKFEKKVERRGIRKEKSLTTTKKQILKTRDYCDITDLEPAEPLEITPLDEKVVSLLKKLKKQVDTVYKVNPTKCNILEARAKRTFVCGLHESLKHVQADNVRCVVVARNLDVELISGPSLFHTLREECIIRRIPIVHASTKRVLSRAVQKFPYTNVIALFYFQGFVELYDDIIDLWKQSDSHIQYHLDQTSLFA